MSMERALNERGTGMESAWNGHEMSMEQALNEHGTGTECAQIRTDRDKDGIL